MAGALMLAIFTWISAQGQDKPIRAHYFGNSLTDQLKYDYFKKLCTEVGHTDQLGTVHFQRGDRRTASCRHADDFRRVSTPPEMVGPHVPMRMKQGYGFLRVWVHGDRAIRFVSVARRARKTNILEDGLSAGRASADVFEFKDGNCQLFRRAAIDATVGEMRADLATQIGGKICTHVPAAPAC